MQKRKKSHAWFFIILELMLGVLIAWLYLGDAVGEKRFLKAVQYSYSPADSSASATSSQEQGAAGDGADAAGTVVADTSADGANGAATADTAETSAAVTISVTDAVDGVYSGTRIAIVSAEASSVISQEGYSNTAYEAYDNDLSTSWQEGVDGAGEGSWLKYTLDGAHRVSSIVFYLGVWREAEGKDYYNNNHRPRQIAIALGGQTWTAEFTDERVAHVVTFSTPVEASEVTFTILSVYGSQYYDDTGIAEIMIME